MTDLASLIVNLTSAFQQRFGGEATHVVRAPGRVNLIGEHTDYNDGFVLPMAIAQGVWLALRPRDDGHVQLGSRDLPGTVHFEVRDAARGEGWSLYVQGVARALQQDGHVLRGFDGVLASTLPVGAGLSSSAALEMAVARAFAVASGIEWNPRAMARAAQRAESDWVGVSCGVMDQMASAMGRAGHALLIDCRSLGVEEVPLPERAAFAILDTGTRRRLAVSAYNERRMACEAVARALGVPALRDLTPDALDAARQRLSDVQYRRARHVVRENGRVLAAAAALRAGEMARVGALMRESHESLRGDYQVSSLALDAFVEEACGHPACLGARMTGAGFGGCAVALVETDGVEDFLRVVPAAYAARTGEPPRTYVAVAADGASVAAAPPVAVS